MAFSFLLQLFVIILLSPLTNGTHADQTQCLEHEKILLLELRSQLVFDSSYATLLVEWNNGTDDCCRWEGVGCDGRGRVISMQLGSRGISGRLNESSSLFSLDYLEDLDLSWNNLSGSLPNSISNLQRLTHLDLSFCKFSGHIPSSISNLSRLVRVDLSVNFFTSSISSSLFRLIYLEELHLSNNLLSGSLPDSIGNLQRLSSLDLSDCKFTGSIPSSLTNLTQLSFVDLSNNFFTGSISSIHFQALTNLEEINLSENSLRSNIPISIFTIPSLQVLYLHHNRFSGQVGEFPILNISTQLSYLDLSSNRLESPIPDSLFNIQSLIVLYLSDDLFNDTFQLGKILSLPNLKTVDLSSNNLSLDEATIHRSSPNNFPAKQHSLDVLDLSNNKISGEIPSLIWGFGNGSLFELNLSCNMLVGLQKPYHIHASLYFSVLDLHSNQLRGELPSSLLQRALYVDYSNNRMSGSFPTSICNATYIQYLDLYGNNLSGTIPPCLFQNLDILSVLNLGRNNINGRIPHNISRCSLESLDLSNNNLVGEVPLSVLNCGLLTLLNLFNNTLSGTLPTSLALFQNLAMLNLGRNNFTGRFPCMLPSSLHVLVLRSNRFHGDITCQNKTWLNLQIIDLASNNFSRYLSRFNFLTWSGMTRDTVKKLTYQNLGVRADYGSTYRYYTEEVTLTIKGVEQKLVKIWPDFTSIDFSNNNFQGDIPDSIGGLDGLYLLNLSHNSLTGTIPKSVGKLRQLEALDLSMNKLTGEIPTKIAGLTFLQMMNVSHNKLVGQIPVSTQIQSFSTDCFQGNEGLCGLPLNISCSSNPVSPPVQGNMETEREEIEWEYVFVAAGYAVGLGSFSWLLLFNRTFRYKYFEKVEDVFDEIFDRCKHKKSRERRRRAMRNRVRRQLQ